MLQWIQSIVNYECVAMVGFMMEVFNYKLYLIKSKIVTVNNVRSLYYSKYYVVYCKAENEMKTS